MQRITYLDDMVIEHLHPAAQKADMDSGYEECNRPEQVASDSVAYHAYMQGEFKVDSDKLKALVATS